MFQMSYETHTSFLILFFCLVFLLEIELLGDQAQRISALVAFGLELGVDDDFELRPELLDILV